jgi:endoglucanase
MTSARCLFVTTFVFTCALAAGGAPLDFVGVNLAGAEFGEHAKLPGRFGTEYTYPNQDEVDYFAAKGMNLIRLPFRWERLQHSLNREFDSEEWARLDGFVRATAAKGITVILDPHNYGAYHGNKIGTESVSYAAFGDFWARLAKPYANDPHVWFGLMNEPIELSGKNWLQAVNTAIAAIRKTGAQNRILVPGIAYSGAHSWHKDYYGTPNAQTMVGIVDPQNNFVIEVHQYLDSDSSGRSSEAVSATIGSERCAKFTEWCREHKYKAFLGEFNAGDNETGFAALSDMLHHLEANREVWIGWTYWAAGPWWGNSPRNLEPHNGKDRPMMKILKKHLTTPDKK